MTTEDMLHEMGKITAQAASDVVANVFNSTPGAFRPVALASMRASVESAVATMTDDDQRAYASALEHMLVTTIKKRGDG